MSRRSPLSRLEARYSSEKGKVSAQWQSRDDEIKDAGTFAMRVMEPLMERFRGMGSKVQSKKDKQDLQSLLSQAGYPGGMNVRQLGGIRVLMVVGLPVIACALTFVISKVAGLGQYMEPIIWLAIIGGAAMMGWISLPFILRGMVKKRRKAIGKQLPDVLDLITIAVEAGMGFDAAMDRVGERYHGEMGDELVRTCNEIRMGRNWNDSMRDLADRTGVDAVATLVTALIQAKELGVNLGNVLRVQAIRLREERARAAREQAQKAPTKMMIPLILFIFPTLFIVLMGPAVLRAADTLKDTDLF